MHDFKIGDRVRCVNTSAFKGRLGTVKRLTEDPRFPYRVEWDGPADEDHFHGGPWSGGALELVPSEVEALRERNAVLEETLVMCRTVFDIYAEHHLSKDSPDFLKAVTNMGLVSMIDDALEAD